MAASPKKKEPKEAKAEEVLAYCMTCKSKRPMVDPKEKTLANGRKALTGACSVCKQKLFLFVKSS